MPGNDPRTSFVDALGTALSSATSRIEGAVVVGVQSWNKALQTVDVLPQVLRGEEQPPPVPGVPVLFPGAYWDLQTGTYGLLVVGGLNWRRWWRTGEVSPVEDTAVHELTNGIFVPGLCTEGSPRSIPANATVLEKPSVGGTVRLGAVSADKAVVHKDLLTDINTLASTLSTWVAAVELAAGPFGGGPALVAAANALVAGVLASRYESPSVKVEGV